MPSWSARTGPTGTGSSSPPPPNPDQWLLDIKAVFNKPSDQAFLDQLIAKGVTVTAFDKIRFDDPYYDGTKWTVKVFNAGGTQGSNNIEMIRRTNAAENAATIFHEGVHALQPSSMSWSEKEYDAYTKEEQWRIDHGLSGRPGFRTTDASGAVVPDVAAIRAFVDSKYPIATSTTSTGVVEKVVGVTADGKTRVVRSDGTSGVREPKLGDTFPGPKVTDPPTGLPVDLKKLK
jgi:hypothetical protein